MKVYISGPMTGYPEWNVRAFHAATQQLIAAGHHPISPALNGVALSEPWAVHLRADLAMLLDAEAVAVLPGWECSRGACLEVHVAQQLGMTVLPINQWTNTGQGRA